MEKLLRKALVSLIDNIDAGNSNITESEALSIINVINEVTSPLMSKYQACEYLNMSRAKFDNLVRGGSLPNGIKKAGFKELFWNKNELKVYVNNVTKDNSHTFS